MRSNQDNRDSWQVSTAESLGALYLVANVLATSVGVFIRRGFGKEALGWNSVFAFLLLAWLGSIEGPAFMVFLLAFVGAQICRRIETFRMVRQGHVIHSQYAGFPYWAMKVPFVKNERTAREVVEPVICFLIGLMLCPVSVGLGGYVMVCGVALIVRLCIQNGVNHQRVQRMQDAKIEHEWYSEQMRR